MEVGNDTFEYILNPRSETTNFASHLSLPKFLKVCYHSPNSSNLKLKLRGLSTMNSIRWRWDSNSDPTRKPVCLCQYAAFPREEVKGGQGKCRGCQARKKSSCGTLLQRTSLIKCDFSIPGSCYSWWLRVQIGNVALSLTRSSGDIFPNGFITHRITELFIFQKAKLEGTQGNVSLRLQMLGKIFGCSVGVHYKSVFQI